MQAISLSSTALSSAIPMGISRIPLDRLQCYTNNGNQLIRSFFRTNITPIIFGYVNPITTPADLKIGPLIFGAYAAIYYDDLAVVFKDEKKINNILTTLYNHASYRKFPSLTSLSYDSPLVETPSHKIVLLFTGQLKLPKLAVSDWFCLNNPRQVKRQLVANLAGMLSNRSLYATNSSVIWRYLDTILANTTQLSSFMPGNDPKKDTMLKHEITRAYTNLRRLKARFWAVHKNLIHLNSITFTKELEKI